MVIGSVTAPEEAEEGDYLKVLQASVDYLWCSSSCMQIVATGFRNKVCRA